jgi:hypothetical protein
MNEPAIDVVVLGVMHYRADAGGTEFWADIAQPDAGPEDYVSVPLPTADHGVVHALRTARRHQTRLRVPLQFFTDAGDEQLTALREALLSAQSRSAGA